MAKVSNIRSFIQAWEGGLSRNTTDSASSMPAPWMYKGVTGWHTNKGVTYKSFVGLANKVGYEISAENFFTMPDRIWDGIFKIGYWDVWYLDNCKSQAIADLLADFSWGSGAGGSFNSIKKYLGQKGISVTNRLQAVEQINKLSALNEQTIFTELLDHRKKFFESLSTFPTFGKGWLNRLIYGDKTRPSLKQHGLDTILKKKLN